MRVRRKRVIIKECGERLVDLKIACPEILISNGQLIFVREGVAKRLVLAKNLLPDKLTFMVNSGWRSLRQQEAEFWRVFHSLRINNPELIIERVMMEAEKYVAPSDGPNASGHLTGGAVDLRLAFKENGHKVTMISTDLTFQENAQAFQPKLARDIQVYRYTMFITLFKAGFVGLGHEWWHWAYGDRTWAEKKDQPAIYGIIGHPF